MGTNMKIKNISSGIFASCLLAPSISEAQSESTRPNILFLFADDMRGSAIHALGNDEIITPNLDQLVQNGTAFVNNYIMGGTTGAVSQPSRAMLMTGRHLFSIQNEGQNIPTTHTTMGEAFQKAGYQTYGVGKWHNGETSFNRCFADGTDIFFGGMTLNHYNASVNNYDPTGIYATTHSHYGVHTTDLFSGEAINFINRYDGKNPFFMYVSFMVPHDPREMPPKYLSMYNIANIATPPNFMPQHPFDNGELQVRDELLLGFPRTEAAVRGEIRKYYAMITHLDDKIGSIIKTLKDKGLYDNTIIVFGGDNGLALGQHGLLGKQNVYEHSVHVPLIFAGKGIEAGKIEKRFTYLHEIFPTLCELVNIPVPSSVQSQSVFSKNKHEELFYAYRNFQRAVRKDNFKLIEYRVNGIETMQLFDLQADPWELNNLAKNPLYADKFAEMKTLLLAQKKKYNAPDATKTVYRVGSVWEENADYLTLQAFLNAGVGRNSGDEIWLGAGVHEITGRWNIGNYQGRFYGGFAGTEAIVEQRAKNSALPWDFTNKSIIKLAESVTGSNPILYANYSGNILSLIDGINFDGVNCRASTLFLRVFSNNTVIRNCVIENGDLRVSGVINNVMSSSGSENTDYAAGGISVGCHSTAPAGYLLIDGCLIQNNKGRAGGLFTRRTNIINSIIRNNEAMPASSVANGSNVGNLNTGEGGGIFVAGHPNGPIMFGCIFQGNKSASNGAGIFLHNTLADNSDRIIANCLFYDNKKGSVNDHIYVNSVALKYHNNITDILPTGIKVTASHNLVQADITPFFTETTWWTPKANFPGIDAGATTFWTSTLGQPVISIPLYDLAGNTRIVGNSIDIGPYEIQKSSGVTPIKNDNDPVISVKYYNLQGIEVLQPLNNGIYLVKRIFASQRMETVKEIYIK